MPLSLDAQKNVFDVLQAADQLGPRSKPVVRCGARAGGRSWRARKPGAQRFVDDQTERPELPPLAAFSSPPHRHRA